ncbi:MAG: hypothetical protein GWO20_04395 [Candidatus Korarchaeota archaeon]|nr:hypothetical protein [Candidatus Korarchaeota archaeon]NIU85225.1 hypothetical protein [Candidatus Thorarchaeota archaeon]NIW15310.1 hypothetical protein [Candidatus Thorarchaeota archaeon]NIW53275.1 hypothetical protein [Candidatus Korarchaeota archaeon]
MCLTRKRIDSQTVKKSKLVVDSKEAVLEESGDIIIPIKEEVIDETHIYAELSSLIMHEKEGRTTEDKVGQRSLIMKMIMRPTRTRKKVDLFFYGFYRLGQFSRLIIMSEKMALQEPLQGH